MDVAKEFGNALIHRIKGNSLTLTSIQCDLPWDLSDRDNMQVVLERIHEDVIVAKIRKQRKHAAAIPLTMRATPRRLLSFSVNTLGR